MTRPMSKILPVGGLVVVGLLGLLDRERGALVQAAPRPNEVLVVNSAADPARTTILGPVTATIANGPAEPVPTTINNPAPIAVSVSGTPSVAVSGPVTVANTDAEAIPVRDVRAEPVPWVGGGQVVIAIGERFESEQFYVPPPGKRLVIEGVNVYGALPVGQTAIQATLLSTVPGEAHTFHFGLPALPSESPALARFGADRTTKIHVRSGAGVIVSVSRGEATAGAGVFDVALTGYLLDEE
jgi:hypothetical protein